MNILKQYLDEGKWFEVSEAEARRTLSPFFIDLGPVMEEIASGYTVYTSFAAFKRADLIQTEEVG